MNAALESTLQTAVTHPYWCVSCSSLDNGPDVAPTVFHGSELQRWRVDDCRLELQLVRTDDPLDPVRGPVGQPHVELQVTALPEVAYVVDGDVIFTMAQAVDLVHRLQLLLNDAARDGR